MSHYGCSAVRVVGRPRRGHARIGSAVRWLRSANLTASGSVLLATPISSKASGKLMMIHPTSLEHEEGYDPRRQIPMCWARGGTVPETTLAPYRPDPYPARGR